MTRLRPPRRGEDPRARIAELQHAIQNYEEPALETHRLEATLDHPDGSVSTSKLADEAVTTAKILDANVTAAKLSFSTAQLIASTTLTADAASIGFSSIPGTFKALWVVAYARSAKAGVTTDDLRMRINADSGGNYDMQSIYAEAAVAAGWELLAQTSLFIGAIAADNAPSNVFDQADVLLAHYANTANQKTTRSTNTYKAGTASGNLGTTMLSGWWRSNNAITAILIYAAGGNLRSGSHVSLYGLP